METCKDFIRRKNSEFMEKRSLITTKGIERKGNFFWVREAWTFLPQSNYSEKVFIIERLRKERFVGKLDKDNTWKKGAIEYRIGYYIVGKIGKANGKWVWGQFCPLIPPPDLNRLIQKAKKEKTIL
jgi:hypothetical protein